MLPGVFWTWRGGLQSQARCHNSTMAVQNGSVQPWYIFCSLSFVVFNVPWTEDRSPPQLRALIYVFDLALFGSSIHSLLCLLARSSAHSYIERLDCNTPMYCQSPCRTHTNRPKSNHSPSLNHAHSPFNYYFYFPVLSSSSHHERKYGI